MMAIFKTQKTYATITAPLAKMKAELLAYIEEQAKNIQQFIDEKTKIEQQINESEVEIFKSKGSVEKIGTLIITDDDVPPPRGPVEA
jgi:cell division septum initiation protein DivIVA